MINFCTCLIEEIHNFYILIKIQKMINSLSKLIYIHVCVQRFVLTNILASQLGPPKPKFMAPPLLHVPSNISLNSQLVIVRLLDHCSSIASTLMWPESQLGNINVKVTDLEDICYLPPSSLIQCLTPRYDATLKKYSG